MAKEKRNKLEGEKVKEGSRLSLMTELWKLTFWASGTEGCVGLRLVLNVWVVLGFTFWLDSDQKRSNSFKKRLSSKCRDFATIVTFY